MMVWGQAGVPCWTVPKAPLQTDQKFSSSPLAFDRPQDSGQSRPCVMDPLGSMTGYKLHGIWGQLSQRPVF